MVGAMLLIALRLLEGWWGAGVVEGIYFGDELKHRVSKLFLER